MKPDQIRDMSADQLQEQLLSLRKKHMDLRFEQASGQIKKPSDMRQARRDVARIKTEMSARARLQAKKADSAEAKGAKDA